LFGSLTLGNLHSKSKICLTQFLSLDKPLNLKCKSGVIDDLEYFGIVPYDQNQNKSSSFGNDFCGKRDEKINECSQSINGLYELYNQQCKGKKQCSINFNSLIDSNLNVTPKKCFNKFSYFYLQSECTLSHDTMMQNKNLSLIILFIGMLMATIYSI